MKHQAGDSDRLPGPLALTLPLIGIKFGGINNHLPPTNETRTAQSASTNFPTCTDPVKLVIEDGGNPCAVGECSSRPTRSTV